MIQYLVIRTTRRDICNWRGVGAVSHNIRRNRGASRANGGGHHKAYLLPSARATHPCDDRRLLDALESQWLLISTS